MILPQLSTQNPYTNCIGQQLPSSSVSTVLFFLRISRDIFIYIYTFEKCLHIKWNQRFFSSIPQYSRVKQPKKKKKKKLRIASAAKRIFSRKKTLTVKKKKKQTSGTYKPHLMCLMDLCLCLSHIHQFCRSFCNCVMLHLLFTDRCCLLFRRIFIYIIIIMIIIWGFVHHLSSTQW